MMKTNFQLTHEVLDIKKVEQLLADENSGGHVIFIGTVRNETKGKKVVRLEFEAYEPMAIGELEKIAHEIGEKWPVQKVILFHRTGICYVGEVPVIAAV